MIALLKRYWLLAVAIVLAALVPVVLVLNQQDVQRTEYVAPTPTVSASQSPSPEPTSSESATPTVTKSPTPKPPAITDPAPNDRPIKVAVTRKGKDVFAPVTIGKPTSFSAKDVWSPVPGTAEWYQVDDYKKPGVLSPLNAVIAGHVAYNNKPNVFAQLKDVKIGDQVVVTYASGKKYTFTVRQIIVDNKEALRANQDIWGYHKPSRALVLFTCDDQGGFCANGHRCDNRAVIAS